jgi:molybdopterin/thiamine biosynthesis adenylyltransferase/rhodanese-related sulfurtransferase
MRDQRYSRHYSLKDFGEAGQLKLQKASVLVIGAGGLGCPALQYLVAAGIGTIGIVDDDVVSLSNLQRQVLYTVADIGLPKANCAAEMLRKLNPEINIQTYLTHVNTDNALTLLSDYDIVVDGTDNFASRYLINDACVILGKPLVFAAVYQYEGQVAIFNVEDAEGLKTSYRDLFETPPSAADAPDCNVAGVLGVLPGIIGSMQAAEVIKLIAGIGKPLINKLMVYNLLTAESFTLKLTQAIEAKELAPKTAEEFLATDYEWFCGTTLADVEIIDETRFYELEANEGVAIIDVREFGEYPTPEFEYEQLPLSSLAENLSSINKDTIVVFCQSGKRSLQAATIIKEKFGTSKTIYSLEGGILNLY